HSAKGAEGRITRFVFESRQTRIHTNTRGIRREGTPDYSRPDTLEAQVAEMKQNSQSHPITPDEAVEAVKILKDIAIAGQEATFEDKLAIVRLLDIHVLYDGETLEVNGSIPTQIISLSELHQRNLNRRDTSSRLPQCAPSNGSPLEAEDSSNLSDRKRNR